MDDDSFSDYEEYTFFRAYPDAPDRSIYQKPETQDQSLPMTETVATREPAPKSATKKKPQPQPTANQLNVSEAQPIYQGDTMKAIGALGDAIQKGADAIDFDVVGLPGIGTLTLKDLTVGDLGKVLKDISEGFPPVMGKGETLQATKESMELINATPAVSAAYWAGKKAVKAIKKMVK
jgi:hypothetical protein